MTQENMPDAEELKQERQPDEETCEQKEQAEDEPKACGDEEQVKDGAKETCEGEKTEEQAEPSEKTEEKPEEDLAKKLAELEDSRLRLMAEYQNYRRRSEKDERSVLISLTGSGEALREKARAVPEQVGACIPLAPERARQLYELLYELLDNMEE